MKCEAAYTAVTYERETAAKRDKVVNRLFSLSGEPALDADSAFDQFAVRVAIDTNTRKIDGRRRSVVGIVIADHLAWGVPYCIELSDVPEGFEERIGWVLALQQLFQDGFLKSGVSTIVAVDAHLGHLEKINRREQGLIDKILLPAGWMLGYASADTGMEFKINRLIRDADRTSSQVMDHLHATSVPLAASPQNGALFGEKRVITAKNYFRSWAELHASFPRSA